MLVATYNIQRGRGLDLTRDLDRTIELLASIGAEIVGLQEVVEEPRGPRGDQTRLIAESLGMYHVFQPARRLGRGHYGVALLSRSPISSSAGVDLSIPRREPRAAVHARIGTADVFVCHFGLGPAERSQQVSRLRAVLRAAGPRRVVMGDFNEPGHGPVARTLEAELGPRDLVLSHPALLPLFALDRIYSDAAVHGLRAHHTSVARVASDHLPVVAEIAAA